MFIFNKMEINTNSTNSATAYFKVDIMPILSPYFPDEKSLIIGRILGEDE